MIRTCGEIALYFALFMACAQSLLPIVGYWRNNAYFLAVARPCAYAQCFFVFLAYIFLTIAFVTNDFSIAYVAANSHPLLPLMYRLTAVWGAHEGSILFWIVMLNCWTLAFILFNRVKQPLPMQILIIAILGWISFSFLCFLLLTSNPFLAAIGQQSGGDLNPLLQDPGFVIHPPMLYIGYVGFSVAFATTLAALIHGNLDSAWAKLTRKFALAAWCFLTGGILLGSWWAYRVLGWGGFWFWDPVENASLLPWLSGTALIHVLILVEKRGVAKAWAALLALICFALSMLGTFLVRSGVLISAHTFANDPARGIFLLLLLAILLSGALTIYITRIPKERSSTALFFFSRETSLLLNSALLIIAMLTILLGTLYPLILDALHLGTISVGAPYFNKVMLPLVFITMLFMGFGALFSWQQQNLKELLFRAAKKMFISIIAALVILFGLSAHLEFTAIICLSLSFWIIQSVSGYLRLYPSMSLAHIGFAVLIIGVMLSSVLSDEREIKMKPGDTANIGPYQFLFLSTQGSNGSNYRGIQASFDITKNTRHIANLYPEKRIYTVRNMVMTKVDIHPSIFRDLYIALGEPLENEYWSIRLYYKPFIRWIWFGGMIMILGSLFTLLQKYRPGKIS